MTYDWLTEEQVEWLVNPALKLKGMALLNPEMCRVLGAWENGRLIESFSVQPFPILGPLIRHDNVHRDNGEISRGLAEKMHEYLEEQKARGYMTIADSPVTKRLCERYGMERLTSPVYVASGRSLENPQPTCNDYTESPTKVVN